MTQQDRSFDVLMVTDCRFPGGTTASVAEEIQAQDRAGYRTGLLHLPSTVLTYARPFSPKIRRCLDRGLATLVTGPDEVHTRLVLARHPTVFSDLSASLPPVRTETVVLAANQAPRDERAERPYYDVRIVDDNLERLFGHEPIWGPIGPRVRGALDGYEDVVRMLPWDWENVIDVDQWQVARDGFVGDRPVIGRHSRGHWTKWPDNRDDLVAAYPDDPRYVVRVLGGAGAPRRLLGGLPANWEDLPFDSVPVLEYLRDIDFFVYFHHPGLNEAFGRVVLEALSAGVVSIVPPYLEQLFSDVCLYGRPQDVRRYVDEQYGDWDAYAERSRRGVELARDRFSYETHLQRIRDLIGPPDSPPPEPAEAAAATAVELRPPFRVLLVDVDGATDPPGPAGSGSEGPRRPAPDVSVAGLAAALPDGYGAVAAVPAAHAAAAATAGLATETFPRAVTADATAEERDRYLDEWVRSLVGDHAPHLVVLVGDEAARLVGTLRSGGSDVVLVGAGAADATRVAAGPAARDLRARFGAALDGLAGAVPDGGRFTLVPAREAPDGGEPPGRSDHASAADGEPSGAAVMTSRQRIAAMTPARLHPVVWRARSLARHGRRFVIVRARRSRRFLRPLVAWSRRQRGRVLHTVATSAGLTVTDLPVPQLSLPLAGLVTHPHPDHLPLTVVVVTDDALPAGDVVGAIAARQQVTSAFRLCLLVPPSWEPDAARYGYLTETLLPAATWAAVHPTRGWRDYLRSRIDRVRRTYGAATVLVAPAGDAGAVAAQLADALEATGALPPQR